MGIAPRSVVLSGATAEDAEKLTGPHRQVPSAWAASAGPRAMQCIRHSKAALTGMPASRLRDTMTRKDVQRSIFRWRIDRRRVQRGSSLAVLL